MSFPRFLVRFITSGIVFIVAITILLVDSCSVSTKYDDEDFDYYEPIIGDEFNVSVDLTRKIDFDYNTQSDLIVETVDYRGYKYTIEIPAFANIPGESGLYPGNIAPITGIQNLPSDVKFLFGLEIEPDGMRFVKPVKITVEIPGNFDIKDLRGFYNQFGWGAFLEPVRIEKLANSTKAIFNVLHFSSYGAIEAGASYFNCPDVRSAQTCEELKEVIACNIGYYEIGINEELSQKDINVVNGLLKTWMEYQLRKAGQEPMDYTDIEEFKFELLQYLDWKVMTQEYNSNPETVFEDIYSRAEDFIMDGFAGVIEELNTECLSGKNQNGCLVGTVAARTSEYIEWLSLAQILGIEDNPSIIGLLDFCDGSVTNTLVKLRIIGGINNIEIDYPEPTGYEIISYTIRLDSKAQAIPVNFIMFNLLDEMVDIPDADIIWVNKEDNNSYHIRDAVIYNNGSISLNRNWSELMASLDCSLLTNPDCPPYVYTCYDLYRNSCMVASVKLICLNK